jgi:hypothetical protein
VPRVQSRAPGSDRWVVGFHFIALLLQGNDDTAGVPASVDDGAKVARGGVVDVAAPLLVRVTVQVFVN